MTKKNKIWIIQRKIKYFKFLSSCLKKEIPTENNEKFVFKKFLKISKHKKNLLFLLRKKKL